MSRENAVALVAKAIRAGIFNDLGSGSNVDICVIEADNKARRPCPPPPVRKASGALARAHAPQALLWLRL